MSEWMIIAAKAFWCGCAALGFGILFNAPRKALRIIWMGGCIAGFIKFFVLHPFLDLGIIVSSFMAALVSGLVVAFLANRQALSPSIVTIPSVIPLVPGIFAYQTMLGVIRLTTAMGDDYATILATTTHNGLKTLFIILGISVGVAIPIELFRQERPMPGALKKHS